MLDPTEMAALDRLMASLARKAGRDDPAAIRQLDELAAKFTEYRRRAGHDLHYYNGPGYQGADYGYSWGEIARELGVSSQAAAKRFDRM